MKKILYLFAFVFVSAVFFSACNKDDDAQAVSLTIPVDDDPLPPPPPHPKIRVVLSSTQVTEGDYVAFTAFSDQEGNVTAQTTFYVNNAAIQGATYHAVTPGTFNVKGTAPNYSTSDPKVLTVEAIPEPEP